jgi:hypothetical protein
MKIAFVGDSFCADTGPKTWPELVRHQLDAKLISKGVQGANQYSILKQTENILKLKPDLIIFTHTDPYRLANRHDRPLGARPCEIHKDTDAIWKAGNDYYEHLMDYGFHELTHRALVNECWSIGCATKTIHLFSFSTKELQFRDYDWDIYLPNSYQEKSLARISYDYQTPDNDDGWSTLPNHMNYAGNKVVSEIVLEMLK